MYLTRKECADRLKVTPQTISNYIDAGILAHRYNDGRIEVLDEDLDKFAESRFYEVRSSESAVEEYLAYLEDKKKNYKKWLKETKQAIAVSNTLTTLMNSNVFAALSSYIDIDDGLHKSRDSAILYHALKGEDIDLIADTFRLSKERVVQIIRRRANRLMNAEEDMKGMQEEVRMLRERSSLQHEYITRLKAKLGQYQKFAKEKDKKRVPESVRIACSKIEMYYEPTSTRLKNVLKANGINTLEDILKFDDSSFVVKLRHSGRKCRIELDEYIERLNKERFDNKLKFGMFDED